MLLFFFFFFQAEDGIRDSSVTGVQTCALPISIDKQLRSLRGGGRWEAVVRSLPLVAHWLVIGRASCRERGKISVVAVSLNRKPSRERSAAISQSSKPIL